MDYLYTGWFVSPETLYPAAEAIAPRRLDKIIGDPHITLAFKPKNADAGLFGTPAEVTVTGYGNDGENEGFLVFLRTEDPALQAAFDALEVPHITLSVSEEGKPVNTRRLEFRPVEPFALPGVFGAMTYGGVRVTDSREAGK